ncbi:hypothetical protein CkaCkLH20_10359 [Colletotrichum karsti]|uniref:Uncharacterized protein n=1 Tax=Colletotrichum karsti TaxID=1095194 RepID=A0A9P6LH81_9PEZI|nr:uncharacterized protein CkaCkLH20_10359 [Colletotrichum karsti]KAF9872267.1 hypothetical protein CkaCkLH20_10359 [Colletotrichum karsti]
MTRPLTVHSGADANVPRKNGLTDKRKTTVYQINPCNTAAKLYEAVVKDLRNLDFSLEFEDSRILLRLIGYLIEVIRKKLEDKHLRMNAGLNLIHSVLNTCGAIQTAIKDFPKDSYLEHKEISSRGVIELLVRVVVQKFGIAQHNKIDSEAFFLGKILKIPTSTALK